MTGSGEERVVHIPGIPSTRISDHLPTVVFSCEEGKRVLNGVLEMCPLVLKSQYLLFASVRFCLRA